MCVGETGLANVDGLKLDDDEEAGAAGAEVVDKAWSSSDVTPAPGR